MRWTLLLGGLLPLMFLPAHAGHSPPTIFLRIYVQTSGEGLPETQARQISIPPNGENIFIRSLPEVTERELIGVHVDPDGSTHLQFNHVGQVDLDAVTAQNQERIMVVMINGYIVYAPLIDEEISTGELVIPAAHALNTAAVQLLQDTARKNVEKQSKA